MIILITHTQAPGLHQNDKMMAKKYVKKIKVSPKPNASSYGTGAAAYSTYKKKPVGGKTVVQRSVVSKGS